jgi:hypothetical protein
MSANQSHNRSDQRQPGTSWRSAFGRQLYYAFIGTVFAILSLFRAFRRLENAVAEYSSVSGKLSQPVPWAVAATVSFGLAWLVLSLAEISAQHGKRRVALSLGAGWFITILGLATVGFVLSIGQPFPSTNQSTIIGELCFLCAAAGSAGGLFRGAVFRRELLSGRGSKAA